MTAEEALQEITELLDNHAPPGRVEHEVGVGMVFGRDWDDTDHSAISRGVDSILERYRVLGEKAHP